MVQASSSRQVGMPTVPETAAASIFKDRESTAPRMSLSRSLITQKVNFLVSQLPAPQPEPCYNLSLLPLWSSMERPRHLLDVSVTFKAGSLSVSTAPFLLWKPAKCSQSSLGLAVTVWSCACGLLFTHKLASGDVMKSQSFLSLARKS